MQMAESVRVPSPPNRSSLVLISLSSSVSCRLTLPSVPFARVKLARLNRVRPQFREVDVAGISNARKDLDRVDGEQISSGVVIFFEISKKKFRRNRKRRQEFKTKTNNRSKRFSIGDFRGTVSSQWDLLKSPFRHEIGNFQRFHRARIFPRASIVLLLFSFLFFFFSPLLHPFSTLSSFE